MIAASPVKQGTGDFPSHMRNCLSAPQHFETADSASGVPSRFALAPKSEIGLTYNLDLPYAGR
jgi:hypothetical protein